MELKLLYNAPKKKKWRTYAKDMQIKFEKNINSLIFLYGGRNFELSFKDQANIIDKERKKWNESISI